MKRKSIMALGLAAVLAMGTCVPVLAANTTGGTLNLTYTATESYQITIPGDLKVTGTNNNLTFTLHSGVLDPDKTITISPEGLSTDRKTDLVLDGRPDSKCVVILGADVTFTDKNRDPKTMSVTLDDTSVKVIGDYKGTVTFTVKSDPTPAQ